MLSPAEPWPIEQAQSAYEPPAVRDGNGPLTSAQAQAVLQRLKDEGATALLQHHLASARATRDSPLVIGNRAELLVDGPATYAAMFRAIEQAHDHINLQSYILSADEVGQDLAELLRRKRAEGVVVNLMYDSVGSLDTPVEYFAGLRELGIAVCEFNPVNPLKARGDWRLNNRNHRKLLVVDGRIGFTGGINISSVYSSGSFGSSRRTPEKGWRDTQIGFEGPIVGEVQKMFLRDWRSQAHCEAVGAADYYPRLASRGTRVMRLLAAAPEAGSETYAALLSAVAHAERSAYLTYGYFVPDQRTLQALQAAARRGVDVRLLLPGFSDFWAPLYAGRSHYEALLESGVRIYERRDALLHAKTAVVDGVWSTVGSTNVDWRSFVHNYEADVMVYGDEFGAQVEALFARDLDESVEISLQQWRKRGVVSRLKEWFARQWEYLL